MSELTNNNILVISSSMQNIDKFINKNKKKIKIYILTDNIDIHILYTAHPMVAKIFFINSAWSYKTIHELERIAIKDFNDSLSHNMEIELRSLVQVDRHVEGENTLGSEIRAAVLSSHQLKSIIKNNQINKVIDLGGEDKIGRKNNDVRKIKMLFEKTSALKSKIKKILYIVLKIMAPKNKYNEITKLNNILLLPAFSCDGNHYRTRELIAQVFSIKGNVKPLIFIMGYSNPEKTNYTFINLCDILSLKDYIYIFIKYIRIVVRVMINLRLNRNIILVKINNKNSLLMKYLTKELFIKVAIASAVDKISSCNTICAMRMLLNFNSFAGNQLYKIKEKNSKVVVFRNDSMAKWGYYTEGDYNKFYDYQFVNSNADKLWYKDKVHKDCKIIDTGNEYVSKKIQERKTFDKVMMPHKIKLLYATGGVTPGVYSKEELYYNLRFLLDIDKSRYEVMIKPHPAEDVDFILQTIEGLGGSNELCILPKNKDIGVFFDEIDLFITKLSTSIWKAAAAGLPVITITNTHDYQENYYEGLACNFSSHNELHRHLIVTSDFDVFSEWRLKRIKSQDDFFLSNDILTNHSPIVKVADRLMVDIGCI